MIRLRLVRHCACWRLLALLDCHLRPALASNTRWSWLCGWFGLSYLSCDRASSTWCRRCVVNRAGGRCSRVNIDVAGHLNFTGKESGLIAVYRCGCCILIQILVHRSQRNLTHLCLIQRCDSLRVQEHLYHGLQLWDVVLERLDFILQISVLVVCWPDQCFKLWNHIFTVFKLHLKLSYVWGCFLCTQLSLKLLTCLIRLQNCLFRHQDLFLNICVGYTLLTQRQQLSLLQTQYFGEHPHLLLKLVNSLLQLHTNFLGLLSVQLNLAVAFRNRLRLLRQWLVQLRSVLALCLHQRILMSLLLWHKLSTELFNHFLLI